MHRSSKWRSGSIWRLRHWRYRGGVYGATTSASGVYGAATTGNGVYGTSASGVALFGNNTDSGSGFYGFSANGPGGVMGSNTTEGARFYTRNSASYALVTGGLSGTFGNAYITGRVTATGGCCSSVRTDSGDRQMYANESTQSIFSDQGTAQLVNGKALVSFDSLFAQTVNLDAGYMVFVTPNSVDTLGLGVINKTATGFTVGQRGRVTANFTFHWRVDAIRKGYESVRMAPVQAAPGPANVPDINKLLQNTPKDASADQAGYSSKIQKAEQLKSQPQQNPANNQSATK